MEADTLLRVLSHCLIVTSAAGEAAVSGRGYPPFPLKEIAVCRKAYGESANQDFDFRDFARLTMCCFQHK
jgi:hypothetical protein